MSVVPFGFLVLPSADAEKKGTEPLLGAGEVISGIGASPANVTNGLVESWRNPDFSDVAVAKELDDILGDILGLANIGLDPLVGFALGLGWSHDGAIDSELAETSGEDESSGAGFIADLEILKRALEFLGQGAKGAFSREIAPAARTMEDGLLARG